MLPAAARLPLTTRCCLDALTNGRAPPRQVPFRLTRDVVDGMGAFGVEGPMRRCCEETMQVGGGALAVAGAGPVTLRRRRASTQQ
jgi:hypothetical protein